MLEADFGLKNYLDCIKDLKRLLEIEPQNREARALTKQALAQQKEDRGERGNRDITSAEVFEAKG